MKNQNNKKAVLNMPLAKIAELVKGKVEGDPSAVVSGAAPFEKASFEDITLAGSAKYLKKIDKTAAGAVIVPEKFIEAKKKETSKNLVVVENPQVAFAKVLSVFFPQTHPSYFLKSESVSSDARIGDNFKCGADVLIAPYVVIGKNVSIGSRAVIHPSVVIGDDVEIGDDVLVYPNVTIYSRTRIGSGVIIHAGTVIGCDGFGFAPDGKRYHKIRHTGIVQIDDDVEIGAGNAIDRATFGRTWIKEGVKTDNLVHIAHNVTVGKNSVIVAQVGISGSTTIGNNAVLAGQAGIAGHLNIGDNVTIGPQAGVAKSINSGEVVSGSPEMPHRLWLRVQRLVPKLPSIYKKLLEIENRLDKIENL